jgi:hypothetical protein
MTHERPNQRTWLHRLWCAQHVAETGGAPMSERTWNLTLPWPHVIVAVWLALLVWLRWN